jgi:hypothetical protein
MAVSRMSDRFWLAYLIGFVAFIGGVPVWMAAADALVIYWMLGHVGLTK